MKRLLAVALSLIVPATLFAAENNGYKVAYDGGSLPDIKAGVGLKLFIDSDQIRLVRDKNNVVTFQPRL